MTKNYHRFTLSVESMFVRNIHDIKEGITSILVTTKDSDLILSINKKIEKNSIDDCLYFVDSGDREAGLLSTIQSIPQAQKHLEHDLILFVESSQSGLKYISHRVKPEPKYDWLDVARAFKDHYAMKEVDETGYWRWGQVIQESGEYLCLDCGYIEDLNAGDIFPVCEVCLAGDPEGPLAIRDGFWEKI